MASACRARGLSADPLLAFGRERRLRARAFAAWEMLRGQRPMPPMEACDRATVRRGATTWHVIASDEGNAPQGPAGDDVALASFSRVVLSCWAAMAAAAAPLHIAWQTADMAWQGMLLPFARADGGLGVVQAVVTRAEMAGPDDLAGVGPIMASLRRAPPPPPAASPWAEGNGALRLLDRPRTQPLAVGERLAVARMRAALGGGRDRPGRTATLNAALAGAFDVLLAARADRPGLSPAGAADLVFADTASASERRVFAMALAQGERLGLERSGFAALLDRFPGGYRGLANAGQAIDGRAMAGSPDALVLEPVDARLLPRLARRWRGDAAPMPRSVAA